MWINTFYGPRWVPAVAPIAPVVYVRPIVAPVFYYY